MKGVNLARVAKAHGGSLDLPLRGASVRAMSLSGPRDDGTGEAFYLALDGELVVDLPHGEFTHLRPGDSVTVPAGTPRRLCPVGEAVLLRVHGSSEKPSL